MTESEFWKMIAQSGDATRGILQQEKKLRKLLSQLTPDEIVSFNDWFGHFVRGAFFDDSKLLRKQYPRLWNVVSG